MQNIRFSFILPHWGVFSLVALFAAGCGGDSLTEPQPDDPDDPGQPPPNALPLRTDLGTLGGESSYAYDVNDGGVVVGASQNADGLFHGFRWTVSGGLQPLSPLPGDRESRAVAITADGTVLGISIAAGGATRPVIWAPSGTVEELAIPPITGAQLTPNDRNAQGAVAGDALFTDDPEALVHAWVWSSGAEFTDLASQLEVPFENYAAAINDGGQVVGTLGAGLWRAYVWRPQSGGQTLGVPGTVPDRTQVTAQGVNGDGRVAGWARLLPPEDDADAPPDSPFASFGSYGYVWSEGSGFTLLAGFPGESQSEAVASDLNDRGDVVGSAVPPGGENINAVAWPRGRAVVALNGADVNPSVALAVNNTGIAVGWTSTSAEGADRATVWNIEQAAPLTARMAGRPAAERSGGLPSATSRAAGCLQRRDRLVTRTLLAECLEGRTN
jgi:probable HAF family extracellular repeat protein